MTDKNTNSKDDKQKVVSPTQAQMDEWAQEEFAEADQDQMLSDDSGALFPGEDNKSID